MARTVVPDGIEGDLTQLSLNDTLPRTMDRLIAQAQAAFEGAQAEPTASLLATAAYPPEAALTAATVLEQLDLARDLAHQAAMQATGNRDRAMRDLRRAGDTVRTAPLSRSIGWEDGAMAGAVAPAGAVPGWAGAGTRAAGGRWMKDEGGWRAGQGLGLAAPVWQAEKSLARRACRAYVGVW